MKRTLTIIVAGLALCYFAGMATMEAMTPKPADPIAPSVEAYREYTDLVAKYNAVVALKDTQDLELERARGDKQRAEGKLTDSQTQIESLRVELDKSSAELQKARQRPEALPQACATGGTTSRSTAVPSVVPYQRRRFLGRFR